MENVIEPSFLVSPRAYAGILTSRRLKRMLLPSGLPTSPYEILDYQARLTLHDRKGVTATFERTERIRFLQEGVSGILDHFWGDGVPLTFYENDAGRVEESFKDEGRRHVVIGLKREMGQGEILEFAVTRTAMVQFTEDDEWLETVIDHPMNRLRCDVVFPKERPCLHAMLGCESSEVTLPIKTLADGGTLVRFQVDDPRQYSPYTVRWSW